MNRLICLTILAWVILTAVSLQLTPIQASSTTVTLNPIADAFTWSSHPDTNYGGENYLTVDDGYKRIYIKFNLSSIPSGSVIISATLKLYDYCTTSYEVCVYPASADWSESTITWNNQPDYNSSLQSCSTTSSSATGSWVSWDVTDIVKEWIEGNLENHGFVLKASGSGSDQFRSKEYSSNKPQLIIEYVEPNTVTQTITETVTETQTQTVTETTTVANTTITETQTETITTTQTINNTVYSTVTTTVANTTYYTTIYETISPAYGYGNQTANYYTDLANQLVPLVMVIGVICTMLSLLLSATKGR